MLTGTHSRGSTGDAARDRELLRIALSGAEPNAARLLQTSPHIFEHGGAPAELPPGDYVLGFRWDAEETAQVWASCSDVAITASTV